MPTEEPLVNIDEDGVRKMLLEVLTYRGRRCMFYAVMVMFELLVILASKREDRSYAATESLRKYAHTHTRLLKGARDLIAHSMYDLPKVVRAVNMALNGYSISILYFKFFRKEEVKDLCAAFEKDLRAYVTKESLYLDKVLDRIPPSLRKNYSVDDTEAALQFAGEML